MSLVLSERFGCLPWTAFIVSVAFSLFSLALFSAVKLIIGFWKIVLLLLCMLLWCTIHCDVPECPASSLTHISIVAMCLHCTDYHINGSCSPGIHLVVICESSENVIALCCCCCYYVVCCCDVPFAVMLQSAPHPCSHTSALLLCVFIALTITSMAPALPAFTWLSAVITDNLSE